MTTPTFTAVVTDSVTGQMTSASAEFTVSSATPKMATLIDSFPGTTLNTALWEPSGAVSVNSGILTITDTADTVAYNGIRSLIEYDLTDSQIVAPLLGAGTAESTTSCALQCNNATGNDQLTLMVLDGNLEAQINVGGVYTILQSTTYAADTMTYLRIREAAGTVYFEYSADNTTWTTFTTVADPFTLTSMYGLIQMGQYGGSDPQESSNWGPVNSNVLAVTRSQYTWPFTWDSIWNMPISIDAEYAATGITTTFDYSTEAIAVENNSVNPGFPVKSFTGSHDGNVPVYCDPNMSGNGQWNDTCSFLRTDGDSVTQAQTLELTPGGNPSVGGVGDYTIADVSIKTSTGIPGAHGGSSLSCLGGTLTKADLTGTGPIQHAMKVLFNGLMYYSSAGTGYQWPASNADGGYNEPGNVNFYGGSNPHIVEGALLALPPSIDPMTRYTDLLIRRIATAMQCYGAYICDNTASGAGNATSVVEMNYDAAPYFTGSSTFNSDLLKMYEDLQVVTNSTSSTPGGGAIGSDRYAPYAPPFTDGTNVPPAVTVVAP